MGRARGAAGCLCLLVVAGCGADGRTIDAGRDAHYDGFPDAGAPGDARLCDPVGGTGCLENQKCTWIRPGGPTTCAEGGTVFPGEPCTVLDGGVDDCVFGYFCHDGTCRLICGIETATSADTCATDEEPCMRIGDVFSDFELADGRFDLVGVCQ